VGGLGEPAGDAPGSAAGAPDGGMSDQVVIGRIGRPHGVRGALRARATGPTLAGLAPGRAVSLQLPDGGALRAVLAQVSGAGAEFILHLEGVATRDAAEALRNALIRVPAEELPPPEEDEFYVRDLIGCRVVLGGREVGPIAEIHAGPANDVLEVRPDASPPGAVAPPLLLPFTRDAVLAVDLAGRRVHVRGDLVADPDDPFGDRSAPRTEPGPGSRGPEGDLGDDAAPGAPGPA